MHHCSVCLIMNLLATHLDWNHSHTPWLKFPQTFSDYSETVLNSITWPPPRPCIELWLIIYSHSSQCSGQQSVLVPSASPEGSTRLINRALLCCALSHLSSVMLTFCSTPGLCILSITVCLIHTHTSYGGFEEVYSFKLPYKRVLHE